MSRIQLALDVDDLDEAVDFYARLLGTGASKRRPGYANFALADPPLELVLIENPGNGGALNHLGVELTSSEEVETRQSQVVERGLVVEEEKGMTCCYARQDKFWVTGPGGERWEHYVVLADSDSDGTAGSTAGSPARSTAGAGERARTAPPACCTASTASPE